MPARVNAELATHERIASWQASTTSSGPRKRGSASMPAKPAAIATGCTERRSAGAVSRRPAMTATRSPPAISA